MGVIITTVLPVTEVSANGLHVGSQEVFSSPAGPYYIRVQTVPMVGNMHMTISVSSLVSADPVSDAKVQLSGRGPRGASQAMRMMPATDSLSAPNLYEVNLSIEEAGEWVFTVTVGSSLGEGMAAFRLNVQESGGVDLVIVGGVVAVLLVLAALSWRQMKNRRPEPR